MREREPDTTAVTSGRDGSGSLAPALWPSTTWQTSGIPASREAALAVHKTGNYGRYANPTVRAFEQAVADLEGAGDALAFSSGMGAIATTILALCSSGDHVVAQQQLYGGTHAFLTGPCARLGIEVTFVDGSQPGAFASAVRPGRTMLVIAETPSNPLLGLVDLDEIGAIRGPYTVVDSTLATPLGANPLRHGASLVLHSATKGIAGHNDAMLGVVAGEKDLIDALWVYSVLHGATASPYDAHNALRGIRTLAVRHDRQCESALAIARFLETSSEVSAVHYPGLDSHPHHALAARQMRRYGSLLSFELTGGAPAAERLVSRLSLIRPAVSLGGPETLICHPASSTHVGLDDEGRRLAGATDGLLRISTGLEATGDLVADLASAL